MLKQSHCIRALRSHLLIKIQVSLMNFINFFNQDYRKNVPISTELLWGNYNIHYFSTSKLFFKVLSTSSRGKSWFLQRFQYFNQNSLWCLQQKHTVKGKESSYKWTLWWEVSDSMFSTHKNIDCRDKRYLRLVIWHVIFRHFISAFQKLIKLHAMRELIFKMTPGTQYMEFKISGLISSQLINCHRSKELKNENGHAASSYRLNLFWFRKHLFLRC